MATKICLDAGHYGKYNRSPVVKEYYESDMNWKLHLKLKTELEKYKDVEVITTRTNKDNDLNNTERGKMSKGCDLFISLHSNGASREDADHIVIFVPVNDNKTDIDEKSKTLANKLAPKLTEIMDVNEKNYRVASVKSSYDRDGDGVVNDNYYGVLHGARLVNTPAMIIEHSFHTNKRSAEWLLVDANLDKLAQEEARIIAEHYGLKKIEENPKKIYRVQVGAYLLKNNAKKMQTKLQNAGYSAIIVKSGLFYKVQVGAYNYKSNAEKMMNGLKSKGYSAFIVEAMV